MAGLALTELIELEQMFNGIIAMIDLSLINFYLRYRSRAFVIELIYKGTISGNALERCLEIRIADLVGLNFLEYIYCSHVYCLVIICWLENVFSCVVRKISIFLNIEATPATRGPLVCSYPSRCSASIGKEQVRRIKYSHPAHNNTGSQINPFFNMTGQTASNYLPILGSPRFFSGGM